MYNRLEPDETQGLEDSQARLAADQRCLYAKCFCSAPTFQRWGRTKTFGIQTSLIRSQSCLRIFQSLSLVGLQSIIHGELLRLSLQTGVGILSRTCLAMARAWQT